MRIMIGNWSPGRVLQQMEITEKEYQLLEDTMRGGSVLVQDQLTGRWFRLHMTFPREGILAIEFWHPEDDPLVVRDEGPIPDYPVTEPIRQKHNSPLLVRHLAAEDREPNLFVGFIRESPKEFEERKELFNRHLPKL